MIMGRRLEDMHPVYVQVVRPADSGRETGCVLCVACVVILLAALAVTVRAVPERELRSSGRRVDAFNEFRPAEMGTFNALNIAALDISAMHEDSGGKWPEITELEEEYIGPFVRDLSWEKSGRLFWRCVVYDAGSSHIAAYMGKPAKPEVSGSFLLVMLHDHVKKQGNAGRAVHAPFEVWFHSLSEPDMPKQVTDQALMTAGWREVVALTGADETQHAEGMNNVGG